MKLIRGFKTYQYGGWVDKKSYQYGGWVDMKSYQHGGWVDKKSYLLKYWSRGTATLYYKEQTKKAGFTPILYK